MTDIDIELSDDPVYSTQTITPKMAEEMMGRNTLNRKIRPDHLNELARDMENGNWQLNGETIKISKTGDVLDGQHRLLAVLLARVPIRTALVENLDEHTRYTVDSNLRRTPSDHFRMLGETDASALSTVLRGAWQYEHGKNFSNHNRPTQRDLEDFLSAHPEARRSAEIGRRCNARFRALSRTAIGTAHFAIIQVDTELSPEFFARIEDGASLDPGNPILAMRNRAQGDKDTRTRLSMSDQIGYVIHTWNKWLGYVEANKNLYKFQFPAGSDIPLPEKPRQIRQEELNGN